MKHLTSSVSFNNDNDIVNINIKNNDNEKYTKDFKKSNEVERIAQKLVIRFNNEDGYKFYCKVAYTLPEARIWWNMETALESGKNPARLFTWLCNKDMRK